MCFWFSMANQCKTNSSISSLEGSACACTMPRCDQRFTPMAQRGQHWRWLWLVTAVVSTCFRKLGGETIGRVMLEPCLPFLDQPWALYLRACWWFPNQRLNYIHDYIFPFLSVEVRQHVASIFLFNLLRLWHCSFAALLRWDLVLRNFHSTLLGVILHRFCPLAGNICNSTNFRGRGLSSYYHHIIIYYHISSYYHHMFLHTLETYSHGDFRRSSPSSQPGSGSTSLRSTGARSRMLAPEGARGAGIAQLGGKKTQNIGEN